MRLPLLALVLLGACTTGAIEDGEIPPDTLPGEDRDGSGSGSGSGVAPADCHEALTYYGVEYTVGPERQGVKKPVTAKAPIAGVAYRTLGGANPHTSLFADCTLIRSLAEASAILKAKNVVEVSDLGIYNYRCIGGGTPPNCPNGVSEHAYATAIDIAGVTDASGTYYSVNDDWVIDPEAEETCAAATVEGKDRFLHELICALKAAKVWTIVLTPNYNAAHRNHFHVDLTSGSDFIEKSR